LAWFLVGCVLFLAFALLERRAQAQGGTIRYVAPTGNDTGNCTDSFNPCSTVQYALDQVTSGGEIRVATGVYTDIHQRAGITQVVYINKSVTIRGGYDASNWNVPPDPEANPTALDAQGQGRVLYITGDISPTLEGLRIVHGYAAGLGGGPGGGEAGGGLYLRESTAMLTGNTVISNSAQYGGGVYLYKSDAKLSGNRVQGNEAQHPMYGSGGGGLYLYYSGATLSGNMVQGNTSAGMYGCGGGLYLYRSGAVLIGNTITANTTYFNGGGLYLYSSGATLTGNTITANTTYFDGGGLYLDSSGATLSGNAVTFNTAWDGGGLYLEESSATLSGNVVTSNTAQYDNGGGLYLEKSDATLTNTVVADNQAHGLGSGLYIEASSPRLLHATIARNTGGSGVYVTHSGSSYSTVALTNTILVSHTVGLTVTAGNAATLNATLWHANGTDYGGSVIHTNDRNGDPAFAPDGYHLMAGSAAMDGGVDTGVRTDVDNEPRPYQTPDLGADEYWPPGALKRIYLPLIVRNR